MRVVHAKTSSVPDAGDTSLVQPSDWNAEHGVQADPPTSTPAANGDLVIEATSNTTLTFKYKGSDGVVREFEMPLVSLVPAATTISLDLTSSASGITVARATAANVPNTSGGLTSVAANVARIGADEILGVASGLWVEGAVANKAVFDLNSAVVGVIGSGGAFPTNMGWLSANGLTFQIMSKDANHVEFTMTGTPSGTAGMYFGVNGFGTAGAAATASQVWCGSCSVKAISTTGLISVGDQALRFTNSGGSHISDGTYKAGIPWQSDIAFTTSHVRTSPALTAFVTYCPLNPVALAATPVTARFRIERPQLEQATFRSVYQASTSKVADVVTVDNAVNVVSKASWHMVIGACAPRLNPTCTLAEVSDGTANNRVTLRLSNYMLQAVTLSGGSTLSTLDIGRMPILTKSKVAISITPTGIVASLNGKTAKTASFTPPAGLNKVQLGGGQDGYWNSTIASVLLEDTAKTGAQVATLAAAGVTFYDDFDRANGAPGTAPTGQAYVLVPTGHTAATVEASISSGRLIAADSGTSTTAAYTGVDLTAAASLMSVGLRYSAATVGGEIVLLQNPNGLLTVANITAKAEHHIIASDTVNWQTFTTGANTNHQTYIFFPSGALDGATEYNAAVAYPADGSVVIVLPNGEFGRFVAAAFAANRGRYHTWEHFWNTGQTRPSVAVIAAQA
jgi:hypothetical protein